MTAEKAVTSDVADELFGPPPDEPQQAGVQRRVWERARRRRMRRALLASGGLVVVAAMMLGPLGLLEGDDGRRVLTGPAAPTSTALLGLAGVQASTLVAPTVVPRGLQFIEGGSSTMSQSEGTITLSSPGSSRPVELTWWPLGTRGGARSSLPPARHPPPIRGARRPTPSGPIWTAP